MVMSLQEVREKSFFQTTKSRKWLKENVYKICRFRELFELKQNTKDDAEKTRLEGKIKHLQNKIDNLAIRGKFLGLNGLNDEQIDEQIRSINQLIVERIKKGDKAETIIQQFIQKKSQNN